MDPTIHDSVEVVLTRHLFVRGQDRLGDLAPVTIHEIWLIKFDLEEEGGPRRVRSLSPIVFVS